MWHKRNNGSVTQRNGQAADPDDSNAYLYVCHPLRMGIRHFPALQESDVFVPHLAHRMDTLDYDATDILLPNCEKTLEDAEAARGSNGLISYKKCRLRKGFGIFIIVDYA